MTRLPGSRYAGAGPGRLHGRPRARRPPRGVRRRVRRARRDGGTRCSRCRQSRRPLPGRHHVRVRGWPSNVVVATGAAGRPHRARGHGPPRRRPGRHVDRSTATHGQLAPGGVLVVGASASGAQIADELARAGRRGRAGGRQPHPGAPPLPRHGRLLVARADRAAGPDIDEVAASTRRRTREPSLQLVGPRRRTTAAATDLDLNVLQSRGVELVGRLDGVHRPPARLPARPRPHRQRGRRAG